MYQYCFSSAGRGNGRGATPFLMSFVLEPEIVTLAWIDKLSSFCSPFGDSTTRRPRRSWQQHHAVKAPALRADDIGRGRGAVGRDHRIAKIHPIGLCQIGVKLDLVTKASEGRPGKGEAAANLRYRLQHWRLRSNLEPENRAQIVGATAVGRTVERVGGGLHQRTIKWSGAIGAIEREQSCKDAIWGCLKDGSILGIGAARTGRAVEITVASPHKRNRLQAVRTSE